MNNPTALSPPNSEYLLFSMELRPASQLLRGRLVLMEGARMREQYIATSGAPQWQQWNDQGVKAAGPIPRCDQVGIPFYEVLTKADFVPASVQPGIAGNFYEIFPNQVTTKEGSKRSHFGIHFDANAPGSAGCVVLTTDGGWEGFQRQMARLSAAGVERLPLQIVYSF